MEEVYQATIGSLQQTLNVLYAQNKALAEEVAARSPPSPQPRARTDPRSDSGSGYDSASEASDALAHSMVVETGGFSRSPGPLPSIGNDNRDHGGLSHARGRGEGGSSRPRRAGGRFGR